MQIRKNKLILNMCWYTECTKNTTYSWQTTDSIQKHSSLVLPFFHLLLLFCTNLLRTIHYHTQFTHLVSGKATSKRNYSSQKLFFLHVWCQTVTYLCLLEEKNIYRLYSMYLIHCYYCMTLLLLYKSLLIAFLKIGMFLYYFAWFGL